MAGEMILVYTVAISLSLLCCVSIHVGYNGTALDELKSTYDFIVVGGGAAGCRVADVLSSGGKFTVLLIEAGGVPPESSKVPLLALLAYNTEQYDWRYKTVAQNTSMLAAKGKIRTLGSGRVLGGGSTINMMCYQRGNAEDYDEWVQKFGANGWSSQEVLNVYKQDENSSDSELSDEFHGRSGPLGVTTHREQYPLKAALFKAAEEVLDLEYGDPNDGNHWGYFHLVVNFEASRAVGVDFIKDGVRKTIRAAREVILSAGALRSPHLLMLSGIGEKKHLDTLKIRLVKDLPGVGRNLQDHFGFTGIMASIPEDDVPDFSDASGLQQWLLDQTGPFATPPGIGLGIIYTSTSENKRSPDVELIPSALKHQLMEMDLSDEILNEYYKEYEGKSLLSFLNLIQKPKSRGLVRLATSDPVASPLIDPKYFSHPDDVRAAVEAAKQLVKLLRSQTMRDAGVKLIEKHFPTCKEFELFSEDYFACLVTHHTIHVFHYSGTCRIGPDNDPLAVLDERLRVRGVDALRVIDTSITPKIPVGHLNAPAVMIASKGAEMILEDQKIHRSRNSADEL